jgi:seryl-tRNA synthetase
MFVLTLGNKDVSNKMLDDIKTYQIELFSDLNLHFKVLNMSSEELGF